MTPALRGREGRKIGHYFMFFGATELRNGQEIYPYFKYSNIQISSDLGFSPIRVDIEQLWQTKNQEIMALGAILK